MRLPARVPGRGLVVLAVVGGALVAMSVSVSLTGADDDRVWAACLHGMVVAVPVGLGLTVLSHRPEDRFALLLVGAGLLWSFSSLAESGDEVLYSVGRLGGWLAELTTMLLLLVYPSGRLDGWWSRVVARLFLILVGVLFLPTALVGPEYPTPVPWSTCGVGDGDPCPGNAFNIFSWDAVDGVIVPVREALAAVLYLAVAAVLARRWRGAGPLLRRVLSPVILVAGMRVIAYVTYNNARRNGAVPDVLEVLGYVYLATVALVALSFAVGLTLRRFHVAPVLRRLSSRLGAHASAGELRAALAEALEDPSLRIVYRVPGDAERWVDDAGWPVSDPRFEEGSEVTELAADGRLVGLIVHHHALGPDRALLETAGAYVGVVIENTRLLERLQASVDELATSRRRIVTVADESRLRIERDLHDGAQQRLVALRVKLSVQRERLEKGLPGVTDELGRLGQEVEDAIDEIRGLARGIYPVLLVDRGLPDALRAVARDAALPTTVDADAVGRYGRDVEAGVYFACLEALQNALKHADGATRVTITLRAGADLAFEVRDDGRGFVPGAGGDGAGLTNVRDRIAALGGRITIESAPREGTRVRGTVPVAAAAG